MHTYLIVDVIIIYNIVVEVLLDNNIQYYVIYTRIFFENSGVNGSNVFYFIFFINDPLVVN